MESFLVAMNAVIPFLFYITFGYTAKIKGIVSEEFLQKLNRMIFRLHILGYHDQFQHPFSKRMI